MILFELDFFIPFIFIGLFLDVLIFHHWRKDGDVFDTSANTFSYYVNCCLCHGFTIGLLLGLIFAVAFNEDLFTMSLTSIAGACIISISALTYRILVLKE